MDTFDDNTCMLKVGDRYDYQDLVKQFTEHLSYDVEAACENAGEIAIRGGIIDIYPSNEQQPYRIDFFGDEIESIRIFDPWVKEVLRIKILFSFRLTLLNQILIVLSLISCQNISLLDVDYPSMVEREHPYRFASNKKGFNDVYSIFNLRNKYKINT